MLRNYKALVKTVIHTLVLVASCLNTEIAADDNTASKNAPGTEQIANFRESQ